MIRELDVIALTVDLPAQSLVAGDVGTAVMVHEEGAAYEAEFVGYDGQTVALLTLEASQVRLLRAGEVPHARALAPA